MNSAGVGRTGTFVLIDHVLHLIRHQTEIDVFGLVLDMRNNRPTMIQTEVQNLSLIIVHFLHQTISASFNLHFVLIILKKQSRNCNQFWNRLWVDESGQQLMKRVSSNIGTNDSCLTRALNRYYDWKTYYRLRSDYRICKKNWGLQMLKEDFVFEDFLSVLRQEWGWWLWSIKSGVFCGLGC